jgi:hypothetical protein
MASMESLNTLLSTWDSVAYFTLALVLIGVVGETIVEWTSIFAGTRRDAVGKVSSLILIAGLGGEIIVHAKISEYTSEIVALLNGQARAADERAALAEKDAAAANKLAGEANEHAGEANEHAGAANERAGAANERAEAAHERAKLLEVRAEELKRDNLKLQKEAADLRKQIGDQRELIVARNITDTQREEFTGSIEGNKQVVTLILPDDQEARAYGDVRIRPLLQKAGFLVKLEDLKGTSKHAGLIVCDTAGQKSKLYQRLRKVKIQARLWSTLKDRPAFCDGAPVRLHVGQRIVSLGSRKRR